MSEREGEPVAMTAQRIPIVTHEMTAAACDAFLDTMARLRADGVVNQEVVYRAMQVAIGAALTAKPTDEEANEFARELMNQIASRPGAICGCPCGCEVPLKDNNAMQMNVPVPEGMAVPEGTSGLISMVCLDCFGGQHPAKAGEEWKGPTFGDVA